MYAGVPTPTFFFPTVSHAHPPCDPLLGTLEGKELRIKLGKYSHQYLHGIVVHSSDKNKDQELHVDEMTNLSLYR